MSFFNYKTNDIEYIEQEYENQLEANTTNVHLFFLQGLKEIVLSIIDKVVQKGLNVDKLSMFKDDFSLKDNK